MNSLSTDVWVFSKLSCMRGATGKFPRKRDQVELITCGERCLTQPMLFGVVIPAQANEPAVRRLEPRSTVGSGANMCALNGTP
jgi:hypothetical protein